MEEEGVRASHGVAVGDRLAAEQGAAEEGSREEEGVRSSHGVAVGDRLAAEQGADWSLETFVNLASSSRSA